MSVCVCVQFFKGHTDRHTSPLISVSVPSFLTPLFLSDPVPQASLFCFILLCVLVTVTAHNTIAIAAGYIVVLVQWWKKHSSQGTDYKVWLKAECIIHTLSVYVSIVFAVRLYRILQINYSCAVGSVQLYACPFFQLPYFMNELTLTELDMGIVTPRILGASKPSIDYRGKRGINFKQ